MLNKIDIELELDQFTHNEVNEPIWINSHNWPKCLVLGFGEHIAKIVRSETLEQCKAIAINLGDNHPLGKQIVAKIDIIDSNY